MKFLADHDVYLMTVQFLRNYHHDVVRVADIHMNQASDVEILQAAKKMNRILITRDKDFGALTFIREDLRTGVILLRISPSTITAVHAKLLQLLTENSFEKLMEHFSVVEPTRYRLRYLK